MSKNTPSITAAYRERAILVGVDLHGTNTLMGLDDSLMELLRLCDTAGLDIVGTITQKISRPNAETLIGSGKVDELHALAEEQLAQVIVFDTELLPRHQRELELRLGEHVRILDRTAIILDIFSQHAKTSDGQIQVKLAQYEYYLPRLTGQWKHLARQTGGGGGRTGTSGGVGLRGPGETQLETDRRAIRSEIAHLKDEIEKLRKQRAHYRTQRHKSRTPTIALVGYTNAGKSTLLNCLSNAGIYTADQLFATLDPTTRKVILPGGKAALFTDTVGFIQKLPTTLVAAFHATLEEISAADLLLHVIDISHPNASNQVSAVYETLREINADTIPMVVALNKIDRLSKPSEAIKNAKAFPNSIAISALTGDGISDLLTKIGKMLFENMEFIQVRIPYQKGNLISLFHEFGQVISVTHGQKDVIINGRLPINLVSQFLPWKLHLPNEK